MDEIELERQILNFKNNGINGFVIHHRIGIPKEIEYLSDRFMEFVRVLYSINITIKRKILEC